MKKTLIAVSAAFGLLLGSTAFAELKIGVINVNKIFLESPQVAAAKADFKKKFEGREKEITNAQKDFQKTIEAFSKNSPTMKADVQKVEQQKIMDQQKKLQEMQMKFQNDANNAQEDALKDFSKKMETVVSKVAKEKGLDLVVAKASLAYNKDELEITNDVLKQMKK
jgi:outer membrane protein